ncbi:hypothetical protein FBU30_005284 [Linnemannia zychae]|nr:hypothetical protein FBU30_005284 [Linnemannia zychae]
MSEMAPASIRTIGFQLKLRRVLEGSDIEKAHTTVSGNSVQDKMDREHEKQQNDQAQECKKYKTKARANKQFKINATTTTPNYYPTEAYISMVITYPAEVVKFQIACPDPEPELEGHERVSIDIYDNKFPKIFSERHVKFLDKLKQHKRRAAEEQSVTSVKK